MVRLRVANPCPAPWESMPATAAGRFCGACRKEVLDLSKMTERDALVVAALVPPGSLCGRIRYAADGKPIFRRARASVVARVDGRVCAALLSVAVAGCTSSVPGHAPAVAAATPVATAPAGSDDADGDGIANDRDVCPGEPEDRDGFEDTDGCPELDNDHDRILDKDDKCPNDPETYNGHQDADGCPDRGGVIVIDGDVSILQVIEFDKNASKLPRTAQQAIDEIVRVLRDNPGVGTLAVRGFARRDERERTALARQRAERVVDALVKAGADRARVHVETPSEVPAAAGVDPREGMGRVTFELVPAACAHGDGGTTL